VGLSADAWDDIWALTDEFYDVQRDYAEAELRRRERIALFRMNGALNPSSPIYWFCDTFSDKRYLRLPRNFRRFWPRHDEVTPARAPR
jgi:hypothetical protein